MKTLWVLLLLIPLACAHDSFLKDKVAVQHANPVEHASANNGTLGDEHTEEAHKPHGVKVKFASFHKNSHNT